MKIKIKRKQVLFAAIGVLFLFLFFLFTMIVRADVLRSFDFNTTVRLQDKTPLRFDHFFSILSVIGRFEYTATFLAIILLLRRRIWGIIVFGLFGFAHVLELIGKTILHQPGPPNMFLRSQYSEFPGIYVHTDASYPSGHSLRSVFLGILLIFFILRTKRLHPILKIILIGGILLLVGAMLYSRVSLGEHWTTDVLGGSLLGIGIAALSLVIL